jgi:hypothetical protein
MIDARLVASKGTLPFLVVASALGLFFYVGRYSRYPLSCCILEMNWAYTSPLGLAYSLLDVKSFRPSSDAHCRRKIELGPDYQPFEGRPWRNP